MVPAMPRAEHHLFYGYSHQIYGHFSALGQQNGTVVLFLNPQRYGTVWKIQTVCYLIPSFFVSCDSCSLFKFPFLLLPPISYCITTIK